MIPHFLRRRGLVILGFTRVTRFVGLRRVVVFLLPPIFARLEDLTLVICEHLLHSCLSKQNPCGLLQQRNYSIPLQFD